MDTVYITGHRNPDTDSIVSAMAYAALKNALQAGSHCGGKVKRRRGDPPQAENLPLADSYSK